MKKLSSWLTAMACVLVTSCASHYKAPDDITPTRTAGEAASPWPQGRLFRVDSDRSELRLVVYPEGAMAALGHPHVIGGPVISGEIVVAEPFHDSALRLAIDADALIVDRPAWREDEGFEPIDPEAAEDTRRNMLSPTLLDAENHPDILIESIAVEGPASRPDIRARITLAGQARELTVPVSLTFESGRIRASGRFVIRQSEFDMQPFSAAGGALKVSDQVQIRFRIEAREKD